MRVIAANQRFAEARVYLWYVYAVVRPGIEVPTFGRTSDFTGDLDQHEDDELKIVVDEGRRQLDRQLADLEKNKSRAATMLTVGLVEIGVLAAGANRVFATGFWAIAIWAVSATLALLALGGAISLLTSSAAFDRLDTRQVAEATRPVLRQVALGYAHAVGAGEETIRTRITVLRDGVLLAVVSALLYAIVWPAASTAPDRSTPQPSPSGASASCPATCTTSSPTSQPSQPIPTTRPAVARSETLPAPSSQHPWKRSTTTTRPTSSAR